MDELARNGRYPSGPCVPAVSHGFAAFEWRDSAAVIDALEPIAGELECIGGSRAQLDLVKFTLLKAYLAADRPYDAQDGERGFHAPPAFPLPGWGLRTGRRNDGDCDRASTAPAGRQRGLGSSW